MQPKAIDETSKNAAENDEAEEAKGGKLESLKNSDGEITELLGSVTTPGTRFSARVIQKMKLDQTRPPTPPNDREQRKKEEEKNVQKTPSNMRAKRIWTNLERNHFFDAINEFGKDFEAIGNYINMKLKRKNATDKTTNHVRQHYYQTYHKICKYIKFSDEVKKPVQELYALINYGEMRRKLQFVTDKHFMKLKKLVYQGHITVRCKGKNIRIKTPSCRALRRINQLDDTLEDIRLPSKIEVILTPANMETFGRLQTIAQNPKVRCMVPLHRKLVNFIKTFQYKWRSSESRLAEEESKLFPVDSTVPESIHFVLHDTEMCFLPKSGVTIHRPLLSITEHLSSSNICLNAYEERLGVKISGETLCQERFNKRQRTDSGSEKRMPESKKPKQSVEKPPLSILEADLQEQVKDHSLTVAKSESSSDELNDDVMNELLSDNDIVANRYDTSNVNTTNNGNHVAQPVQQVRSKRTNIGRSIRSNVVPTFKPLLNDEAMRRIRQGWTVSSAGDITIGDLYVVLGQDSRLELEYYWTEQVSGDKTSDGSATNSSSTMTPSVMTSSITTQNKNTTTEASLSLFTQKLNGMPYNPNECDDVELLRTISSSKIHNKLKHLLLIANLSERITKRQCSCGHICDRNAVKTRIERDNAKTIYSGKLTLLGPKAIDNNKLNLPNARTPDSSVFRQPSLPPRRPLYCMDPVKQLAALSGQKMSRQVFVQRSLLPSTTPPTNDIVNGKLQHSELSDNTTRSEILSQVTDSEDFISAIIEASDNTSLPKQNVCSFAGTVKALSEAGMSTPTFQSPSSSTVLAQQCTPTSADSAIDDCSSVTSLFDGMSPMHLIRETTSNSRWLEDNLNDFSLTSLLGHLDEINANRDIVEPSNISVISESSVDYMHKFQEISALMQKQDKD